MYTLSLTHTLSPTLSHPHSLTPTCTITLTLTCTIAITVTRRLTNSRENTHTQVQSLFSLKHNRSLRLQRWGSWIAYEDQGGGAGSSTGCNVYWYNQRTGVGQWDKPEKVARLQQQKDMLEGERRAVLT